MSAEKNRGEARSTQSYQSVIARLKQFTGFSPKGLHDLVADTFPDTLTEEELVIHVSDGLFDVPELKGRERLAVVMDKDAREHISGTIYFRPDSDIVPCLEEFIYKLAQAKKSFLAETYSSGVLMHPFFEPEIESMNKRGEDYENSDLRKKFPVSDFFSLLVHIGEEYARLRLRSQNSAIRKLMVPKKTEVLPGWHPFDIRKRDELGIAQTILEAFALQIEGPLIYCTYCGDVMAPDGKFYHQRNALAFIGDRDVESRTSFPPLFNEMYPQWKPGNYFLKGDVDTVYCPDCTEEVKKNS